LTPTFWHFQLPKTPPPEILISLGLKNKVRKKKVIKTTPQKIVRALPFVLARWRQKKKVGIEQEKVAQVILDSA
jgi:hypothetical protein